MTVITKTVKLLPIVILLVLIIPHNAKALTVGFGLPYGGVIGMQLAATAGDNRYFISTGTTFDGYGYGAGWERFLDISRKNLLGISAGRFKKTDIFGDLDMDRYVALNYTHRFNRFSDSAYSNWAIGGSIGYFYGDVMPTINLSYTF